MKTKIKRHSRSALAVILTLCLLVSCMTVGIIATDAAKTAEERVGAVDGNEAVGAVDGNKAVGAVDGNKAVGAVNGNKAVGAVDGNKAVGETSSVKFYVVNKCNYNGWNGDSTTWFYQKDLTNQWHGDSLTDIGHYAFLGTYNMSGDTYENAVFSSGSGTNVYDKSADTTIYNTGSNAPKIYIIKQDGNNQPRSVETKNATYFLTGKINGSTNWNRIDKPFTYSNGTWSINVTLKNGDEIKAALGYDETYAKGGDNNWCVSHGSGKSENNGNYAITEDGDYIISFTDGAADGTPFTVTPAVEDTTETVDIYAKNGTLRDSTFNRFTNLADTVFDTTYFEYTESLDSGVRTYTSIADYNAVHSKKITYDNAVSGYNSDYAIMKNVPIGAKIKIKTTLSNDGTKAGSFNNTAFKDTHYLKAYSFNGMSYQVNTPNNTGVYEEIWTVRDVNTKSVSGSTVTNLTKDGKSIEVTPIYYMQDNTNCKTFYIDGYDGTVQNAWGNMLCVYPYYEGKSNAANAFGGYPGQPMLFWGGKYQMEIPLTVDGTASGASVKGLTLHNSYWDLLHRSIDIRCNARNHAQTYDYDDFYKLYKEKNPDTIIFDFKYRTAEDNYGDVDDYTRYAFAGTAGSEAGKTASDFTGDGHNGVELVTDYFGRQVDAFGNLIADANKSQYGEDNGRGGTVGQTNELLFVSTGYKDTYVGEYATIWAVYQSNGTFIGYISSSMLYLNNIDRRLQYTGGDSTASGRMSWPNFISTYNTLKSSYTGVPALIVYDREIWNNSKDKAYRSDGKWYYSNKSDQISANIIIQYNSDPTQSAAIVASKDRALSDTSKWTSESTYTAGVGGYNNVGSTTTCSAYFTNTSPNLLGKVESGTQFADSTKSFTFRADADGGYMFVNWVRFSNGKYYEISENELAESVMSSNDTYIARFVKSSSGSLKISHVVERNATYKGTGTPSVTVTVENASDVQVFTKTVTDGTPIDISDFIQTKFSAYKINISLSTTPDEDCALNDISTSAAAKYTPGALDSNAATVTQFTVNDIITDNVSSLRYVSHLTKTVFTYTYEITYTYTSRFWGEQSYTQTGTAEEGDFTGSKTSAKLTKDFIIDMTPYEKNFRQQINWNYTNSDVASAGGTNDHGAQAMVNNAATAVAGETNTYKMTAHVYASKTVNDKVTAEFVLPYKYNEKAQGYTVKDTDVYNSSGTKSGTSYLYDSGNESVTLSTKAYSLFTYDDEYHTGSNDNKASSLPLMEAAPYVWMNVNYHTKPANTKRYYTGNSFKVGNITYYLREKPDGTAASANEVIITDADVREGKYTVTFTKRSNMTEYGGDGHTTTYKYAVAEGTPGTVGYKVYFFAYNMNASEQMTTNEGTVITDEQFIAGTDPVFNGQYIVYTETEEKDGIIQGTGAQKFFTRWDIFNTKGDFVTSCYSRRFSFSGYDNYVVKPIYESNEEQHYASSSGLDSKTSASITYLGDTRNQWNNGALGNYATVTKNNDGGTAGDKLIHDFALAFAYNGQEIQTIPNKTTDPTNGHNIKIGMIIEQLDTLDSAGGTKITDSSYYAEKYNKSSNVHRPEDDMQKIKNLLEGKANANPSTYLGHTCINSKIGNNVDDNWGQKFGSTLATNSPTNIMSFDSVIDNFNRLQWFYTFNNTKTGGVIGDGNNANFAYRAWSYIIVDGTATVSASPTYFTLYESASR